MDRPRDVARQAEWSAENGRWVLLPEHDDGGARKEWSQDGVLLLIERHRDGKPNGTYRIYSNDGDMVEKGNRKDGALHGTRTLWRGAVDGATLFEGVSEAVTWLEVDYDKGRSLNTRYFDENDRRTLKDGTFHPDPPRGVPSLADYDADKERWVHGPRDADGARTGLWMWWTNEGSLVEECQFVDDERHGLNRRYDEEGVLVEEGHYAAGQKSGAWSTYAPEDGRMLTKAEYEDGVYSGSVVEYGPDGRSRRKVEYADGKKNGAFITRVGKGIYADERVRIENGQYRDDRPVGRWKLLDKAGKPVATVDYGITGLSGDGTRAGEVFDDRTGTLSDWQDLADELSEERRIGESLLALARVAAIDGSAATMLDRLTTSAAALTAEHAAAQAAALSFESTLGELASALVAGGAPTTVLRVASDAMTALSRDRAALDFADAAVLLAPSDAELRIHRAERASHLGLDDVVRDDAVALKPEEPDAADALRTTVDALFPTSAVFPQPSGGENRPCPRDIGEVQAALSAYATRVSRCRAVLVHRIPAAVTWLPPDTSAIADAAEPGPIPFPDDDALQTASIPELAADIRADYAALTWLCWAVGSQRVEQPRRVVRVNDLDGRLDEAQSLLDTLQAKSNGKPHDGERRWHGAAVNALGPEAVDAALLELRATVAVLRWAGSRDQTRWPWEKKN